MTVPANQVVGRICEKTVLSIVWSEVPGVTGYFIRIAINGITNRHYLPADSMQQTAEYQIENLTPGTLYEFDVDIIATGTSGSVNQSPLQLRTSE